jgi:hypothetical protein
VFTVKVDSARHQDQGSVKGVLVASSIKEELVTSDDNVVVNALLLTVVIHTHIS